MPSEKFAQVLPSNWNGTFPFTNDSDEDFIFTWSKKAYLFPARKTIDLMRMAFNATPLEVQQIRKFAARQWAEREFFKSTQAKVLESYEKNPQTGAPTMMSFQSARSYSESDLKEGIQHCLTPLPEGQALMADADVRNTESELHTDEQGKFVTPPIENQKQSVAPGEILIN